MAKKQNGNSSSKDKARTGGKGQQNKARTKNPPPPKDSGKSDE